MNPGRMGRSIGLAALALLPLASAGALVAALARDAHEMAGAAAAVGGTLSLIASLQLLALRRETRRVGDRQQELRDQALALARCMRELNARLPGGAQDAEADEATPIAGPAAIALAPPEPAAPRLSRRPILGLPGLNAFASRLELAPRGTSRAPWLPQASPDAAFRDALVSALDENAESARLLAIAPLPLSRLPATREALKARPALRESLILGVSQASLRDSGEAEALAELARAGLRLALTDVRDFRLDPAALRACGFVCLETSSTRLLEAAAAGPRDGALLMALARRLRAEGVELICAGADQPGEAAKLAALGVVAASGAALAPAPDLSVVPWRAAPEPPAPRSMRGLLRRAG
jgi:hypothetical protein